jgi:hypothetical protein
MAMFGKQLSLMPREQLVGFLTRTARKVKELAQDPTSSPVAATVVDALDDKLGDSSYGKILDELLRDAPPSRAEWIVRIIYDAVVPDGYNGLYAWHLLYVGVPPFGTELNPLGLREQFVVVPLPVDVCFMGHCRTEKVWWFESFAGFKFAYDSPVGHKQVFNFGPVCLRLVTDALEQSKKAVHTWPAEYVERNHALLTECESCT